MVDLNLNTKSDIYIQPTDPDTLKILEKIKKDYEVSKETLSDTDKVNEAKSAVLHGLERRETDPTRAFVNMRVVLVEPADKKVTGLHRKISDGAQETPIPSLNKRAKKHS